MKPHHLRLRGIGPFRDEVDLDLAAIGAGGVFLLEGPTGSGKSTILDAIVYALYGHVAGAGASPDRIRSQFSDPAEPSVVDLVFETGSGIYRVRREPERLRPKPRGSGTTKEQASAILWRLTSPDLIAPVLAGEGGLGEEVVPIATRLDEVGREIARAVGLTREQFTQTVLLPQGEFARFLRARTEDRQAVLTRVFGTEVFEEIEKRLEVMRRAAKAEVTEARRALTGEVARFAEAAGTEDEARAALTARADAFELDDLAADADEIGAAIADAAQQAVARRDAAVTAEGAARSVLEAARETRRRVRRREELDALAARLAQGRDAHREDQHALRLDEAARPVLAAVGRRDTAALAADGADRARDELIAAARADVPDLAARTEEAEPAPALASAQEHETARAGELAGLAETESGLAGRAERLAARRDALTTLEESITSTQVELEARPAARQALVQERDEARTRGEALSGAQVTAHEAQGRLTAARAAVARSVELEAAREAARVALVQARQAADAEHTLRSRRTAHLAAELALSLEPAQPCPVCGATEHPSPASSEEELVDDEQLDAAEKHRVAAEATAASLGAAVEVAGTRLDAAVDASAGLDVPTAVAAEKTAQAAVAEARTQLATAARAETRIAEHDEQTAALRRRVAESAEKAGALRATLEATAESLDTDRRAVAEARGEHASVSRRRAVHRDRARWAGRLREAVLEAPRGRERVRELGEEVTVAREEAAARAREDGEAPALPARAEDAAAFALTSQDRERRGARVAARTLDEARLADGLAEPGIRDATADEDSVRRAEEALTAAGAAVETTSRTAGTAREEAGQALAAARRTTEARATLDRALAAMVAVRENAGAVVRVADLATGGSADGDRIRLSTFVLMRRFEDVIVAANARLRQLSGADLELARDTGARGARRTGLDLLVVDRRTDQSRVPETLSGGETFFVSLALALGLADIVSAEAGGVQIQTLFIDEGFGSLDPERLDAVIEEIGHLADSGRTVGIVSHVGELKTRIPEQIHVRRRPDRTSEVTVTA